MKVFFTFYLIPVFLYLSLYSKDSKSKSQYQDTIITGDQAEYTWKDTKNSFYLYGNVHIITNNLIVDCDHLKAYLVKKSIENDSTNEMGTIEKIIAIGNVVIQQAGRRAESGKVEILPLEGKIVLTENPVIFENQGEVRGEKITLFRGKRRALVESSVGKQVQIKLPQFDDLGFYENEKADD